MLTPADESTVLTTIPILTVGTVTDVKYYQFQMDAADDFTTPPVDVTRTTLFVLTESQKE